MSLTWVSPFVAPLTLVFICLPPCVCMCVCVSLSLSLSVCACVLGTTRRIAANLSDFLPSLEAVVLTNNNLSELGDLDPLFRCKKINHLTCVENHRAQSLVFSFAWVVAPCFVVCSQRAHVCTVTLPIVAIWF